MMQKKKLLVAATAIGLLGTSAAVGASGLVSKVTGEYHKDVVVTVNGTETELHPVYINGKAYLPARDAAAELGYTLNWNSKGKEISIKSKEEQAVEYARMLGVIVDVSPGMEKGSYRVELLGNGDQRWIILGVDKDTELTDESGKAIAASDLKAGARVMAEFGPIIAMSFPGQSQAHKIVVQSQALTQDDVIQSVEKTDDGWQVKLGETKDGNAATTIVLNAGKETSVMTSQGEPVAFANLKAGDRVRAYYGPMMTKSLPPQSPLHYLIVLSAKDQLAPATVEEYRDLAWKHVPEEQKSHLTTAKENAQVSEIDSQVAGLLTETDAQKKKFEEIKAANGKLIAVLYDSDQNALIGPLQLAFDPDTKQFLGFFPRR
ncbi:stalk domain-containing protein [Cohnella terricola]|uniref:Copper amine oxidase-like N-terminal domain-containing protein n=1 Tax=Cohnella terricola TaxID=1289167 RepID=A0A559JB99_9BACL|nr:stalk domain-containing protein [Cohnella terricola]TVX97133.1 hypothetical protein FPZ45_19490 [Cohnella terricola]